MLKLITPPTDPCLDVQAAKEHLRVDSAAEDALIEAYVLAAEQEAEAYMSRAIMPQVWQLSLDAFPASGGVIKLQRPPVVSVQSVTYIAEDGSSKTMASGDYQLYLGSEYQAQLGPAFGTSWPATRKQPEAVKVAFRCGYIDAASVPELIKAWIKLRLGTLYSTRESDVLERGADAHLSFADFMLDRYRVWLF